MRHVGLWMFFSGSRSASLIRAQMQVQTLQVTGYALPAYMNAENASGAYPRQSSQGRNCESRSMDWFFNKPFASHTEHRGVPTITLVTCFPFYFAGDAPQRYVLHCSFRNKTCAARRRLRRRATALGMTPAQRVAAWAGCMPLNRGLCFKLRL